MKSLFVGIIVGIIFSVFKLPIPAPSAIEGIIGIFGIWLGYIMVSHFMK